MNNCQLFVLGFCALFAFVAAVPVNTLSPEEIDRLTALAELELRERLQDETPVKSHAEQSDLAMNKRAQTFVRFGKRAQTFVRFGKRAQTFVRFG